MALKIIKETLNEESEKIVKDEVDTMIIMEHENTIKLLDHGFQI